ncbi:hypothetical protein PQR21_26280 [Paraburkholderia nemoris]|uniref:esterase/lipase family protein n=1 Tax=Paraburkholderia nemoris TaxID=2793076 RepID=UPI0038BCA334
MAELIQEHNPVDSSGKPRVVFIHGLDGHFRDTWMADSEDDSTLWPKWVGDETGCPVWLLGYGAATSRWKADAMALPRQATAVLERLSTEPAMLEGPLVLIGHSLGGLVIKTMLRQGIGHGVSRHEKLARNIKGIAFVGTPHFGSRLASIAASMRLMRSNPQVSDLRMDNAHLEELNHSFLKLCQDLNIQTRVFTETRPVRISGWIGRVLPGLTVVSPISSLPHIPGEVGTPIEADHITICKPVSRSAAIHTSMVAFVKEVEIAARPQKVLSHPIDAPLGSDRFDAISPDAIPSTAVHLAFATSGFELEGATKASVCGTVCLVTDAPDDLRKALEEIRAAIRSAPLIPSSAKDLAVTATLSQLVQNLATRAVVLRSLAVISFSAYLYYCPKSAFDQLSPEQRVKRMLVDPVVHRLSAKRDQYDQVHTRLLEMPAFLKRAATVVEQAYHRTPKLPRIGMQKYGILEELAALVAAAACAHLGNVSDGSASELFESLRTRVRYAENIATGEKHKRDVNPLP